jgi:hypothetical protein
MGLRGFVQGAVLVATALWLGAASPAAARVLYSLDAGSPGSAEVSNSDLLSPSAGAVGVPAVDVPAAALGLSGGALDEVDALSVAGPEGGLLHFSIDRYSVRPGGEAHGDVSGMPRETETGDDLDALALAGEGGLFFSLAAGNLQAFGGADVLAPGPRVAIPASALGLTFLDDIDALHVSRANGDVYFSLTPASPSLARLGAGPADVLVARGGVGPPVVFAASSALGLLSTDNVDALVFVGEDGAAGVVQIVCAGSSLPGVSELIFAARLDASARPVPGAACDPDVAVGAAGAQPPVAGTCCWASQ